MRPRPTTALLAAAAAAGLGFALVPARAEQVHRHGFGGRATVLVRGDANVRADENEHDVSRLAFHSQPSSEHLKLTLEAATGDAGFVHYQYDTPPAPVTGLLTAGVWVKATRPGVQLRARVVFPKEPDPANPQSALTMLVVGKTYEKTRQWEKLTLEDVPDLVAKHLPVLRAKTGRAVNADGAYVDRLVLNVYTGPGAVEVWVDDLDIGPTAAPPARDPTAPGVPVKQTRPPDDGLARGRQVDQRGGQLSVDGRPFLFRAVRHTGTPLHVLRQAGFDTLFLPPDAAAALLDDANRDGWFVVPTVPLAPARAADDTRVSADRAGGDLARVLRQFGRADVLFYDLGGGRTAEDADAVSRTAEAVRQEDPRRPRGADVWDGFGAYGNYLDVVGAHRWPLFTGLPLDRYRDWLAQRRTLTARRATFWTWVQNHLPDWYVTAVLGKDPADPLPDPVGPHPEQVRVMAHLALAAGCRGLGLWSDRYLADSTHGRDRLQGAALLNAEIDMLAPALLAATEPTQWLDTSHPHVKAALLRGTRGAVLLPVWLGPGGQFVPDQAALGELSVLVPLVPDGADPWRVGPAGVECLAHAATKEPGGTRVVIREFDTACPVVFTADRPGLVAWWQDYARKYGRLAARWALDLAAVQYEKTAAVHARLAEQGVRVRDAETLFAKAVEYHTEARKNFAAGLYDKAHADALRAVRPLRIVMRDHWQQAAAALDTPTASPHAVSFYSLPKHWELAREVRSSRVGENALPTGGFEPGGAVPAGGVRVDAIPGWSARFGTLDPVQAAAGVVPAEPLAERPEPRKAAVPVKGPFAPSRPVASPDEGYVPPQPELGSGVLKLEVRRREAEKDGKKRDGPAAPLERTFLAVDGPAVALPAGTLVRVSGWVKVPAEVTGSADGVLFYDDAGGEPLGVRVWHQPTWKRFHLYRRVPATGKIGLTVALTGVGVAYFDDLRVEPLIPGDGPPADPVRKVVPAGYPPRR
ncbi:MAG: hypothetical protein C0501_13380 [Isosphaera sp.]|nr:hypothetical protein [Isosphaera sp.]